MRTMINLHFRPLAGLVFILAMLLCQKYGTAQEFHGGDTPPVYKGGSELLRDFIRSNLNYPDSLKNAGVSGVVVLKLWINENGKAENVRLIRGINEVCDAEAIRVAGMLNDWKPAERMGRPAGITILLPVEFRGEDNGRNEQPFTVRGNVSEKSTGKPIEGALVIVKGTNYGTVADINGNYSLDIPKGSGILEIMSIGYVRISEVIGMNHTINSEMDPDYFTVDYDK